MWSWFNLQTVDLFFFFSKSFSVDRKDWSKGPITLENSELQVVFDSREGMMTVRDIFNMSF